MTESFGNKVYNIGAQAVGESLNAELTFTERLLGEIDGRAAAMAGAFSGAAQALRAGANPVEAIASGMGRAARVAAALTVEYLKHRVILAAFTKAIEMARNSQRNMLAGALSLTKALYANLWKIRLAWNLIVAGPMKLFIGGLARAVGLATSLLGRIRAAAGALASGVLSGLAATGSALGGAMLPALLLGGGITGAAFAGAAAFSKMAMEASDLAEATDLVRVQFGRSADLIFAKSDELAEKFGVVRSEFLSGVGTLAGLLDKMGQGSRATAEWANRLGQLATDMASAFNTSFEEELIRIRAALAGETEPLRRYGVDVSAAAVEQEALRQGLIRSKTELTETMKVQARAAIVVRELAKINGNLEQTYDGVANSVRSLQGRLRNLQADIGGAFETVSKAILAATLDQIQALAGGFDNLRPAIQQWAQTTIQYGGFVNEAIGKVGNALAWVADAVGWLRQSFKVAQATITASLSAMVAALIPFGVSLDAILSAMTRQPSIIAQKIAAASGDLAKLANQQRQAADAIDPTAVGDRIRGFFDGIRGRMDEIGRAGQNVIQQVAEGTKQVEALRKDDPKLGGVLEFGSAEARSAILSAQIGMKDTAQEQTAENTERVANNTARMEASLSTLVGYFVGTQVAKL